MLTDIQRINHRKLDLQTLRDQFDLAALSSYPKPRPLLVLTQSHLTHQISKNFAEFSKDFDVFVYGSGSKGCAPGARRITEHLTRSHPIFDQENECNSQVVVVTSYDTLQTRHGPAAIKKYLRSLSYKSKVAERHKFQQLRDRDVPDWKPPMDLEGLFDEAVLDEAQNTKGLFCKWIWSYSCVVSLMDGVIRGQQHMLLSPKLPVFSVALHLCASFVWYFLFYCSLHVAVPHSPRLSPNRFLTVIRCQESQLICHPSPWPRLGHDCHRHTHSFQVPGLLWYTLLPAISVRQRHRAKAYPCCDA